jgi:protein-S-isoprenylcysteine O-methyltransferase Ste14
MVLNPARSGTAEVGMSVLAAESIVLVERYSLSAPSRRDGVRRFPAALGLAVLAVPGFATVLIDLKLLALGSIDLLSLVDILGHTMATLFLIAAACCTVLQLSTRRNVTGARVTIAALGGSFLLVGFAFLTQRELPAALSLLAAGLIAIGYLAATIALLWLGRSFSIMPSARRLRMDGPFALVRHPLYLGEEFVALGLFLHYLSWPAAGLLILHFLLQLERMRYEERVLAACFPDYPAYAARTARLIPGLF